MLSILIITLFLFLSISLAAPAPARPAAAIPSCYEIVITTAAPPSSINAPLLPETASQTLPSILSIITPAPKPDLRHKNRSPQWSSDLLPVETDSDYYWDPDNDPLTGFSWPTVYPPWFQPGNTQLTNTGRLTVTLGKKQLSPVTWGNSVLPVQTEGGWGEGKTFTFAGQTYTIGGSGKLTITLGHPPRTALAGGVEERQELSYEGGSMRGAETASEGVVNVVTFTDVGGEVRTLTVGEGETTDTLAFTQSPP